MADAFVAAASPGTNGLDNAAGTRPANSVVGFTVAGTAPAGAITLDQATFFEKETDTAISGAALATVTPDVSSFSAAQVGEYFSLNPMNLRNANITGADVAATVTSLTIRPTRSDPFGSEQTGLVRAQSFLNAGDFQTDRVNIPLSETMDGYSKIRIVNTANATPASYNVSFTFGPRMDRRSEVPNLGGAVIVSSANPRR